MSLCYFAIDDGFDAMDLFYPKLRMREIAEIQVKTIAETKRKYCSWQGMHIPAISLLSQESKTRDEDERTKRDPESMSLKFLYCEPDVTFDSVNPKDVKALIVPGGLLSPDRLRSSRRILDLISQVYKNGGVVGFIGHGSWVAISAGITKGKRMTASPPLKDDLVNSGANWSDERVCVDKNMVTCQDTKDTPQFMMKFIETMKVKHN